MVISCIKSKWLLSLGIVLITFSVIFGIANADNPDAIDLDLLNKANKAITDKKWIEAVGHILLYLQRSPDAFENEEHAKDIVNSLEKTMDQIESYINKLESDLCFFKEDETGVCSSFREGPLPNPPPIPLPSTSPLPTPPTSQLVCRGGGEISFTYTASSNLSTKPQIWLTFEKASFGVGNDWRDIGNLTPGQCAWLDHGIGADEPNRIVIKEPVLTPNRFAINWSQGRVKSIQSQAVTPSAQVPNECNTPVECELRLGPVFGENSPVFVDPNRTAPSPDPVTAVNNLQSPDWVQAFDIYTDNEGNFIVTKVGDSRNLGTQPNSNNVQTIIFQNGQAPDPTYIGTADVTLEQAIHDVNADYGFTCFVDGDDPQGTGQDRVTLIRWDIGAIPPGRTITAASITLNIIDSSNDVYYLYEMKQEWVGNEATWYVYRYGSQWASAGASSSQDRGATRLGFLEAPNTGKAEIHLNDAGIALVQSWVNNPANNRGLIIGNSEAGNGIDFDCSEVGEVANRPALTLTYTEP